MSDAVVDGCGAVGCACSLPVCLGLLGAEVLLKSIEKFLSMGASQQGLVKCLTIVRLSGGVVGAVGETRLANANGDGHMVTKGVARDELEMGGCSG